MNGTNPAGPGRSAGWEMLAVGLFALTLRAAYLAWFHDSVFFAHPVLDSAEHDRLARAVAAGRWDAGAPYFRPPLFVWLLGLLYRVGADGWWAARVLQAMLGASTAAAVTGCAARLGWSRPGRSAVGLAAAAFAPALFFEGELLTEPLATALTAWGLYAVLAARDQASAPRWGLAAAGWSLAALARAPLAVLPPMAAMLAWNPARGRAARVAVVTLVSALVWAGPAAIMAKHDAGWRFPTTQGGVNFYAGNHPHTDGRGVVVPELAGAMGGREFADASVRAASRATGKTLGPAEASAWWWRRGLTYWRDHPADAVAGTVVKLGFLLHGFETPNNRSLYAARAEVPWLGWLLWKQPGAYWPSGLLIPLALVGAWTVARRPRWRPVLWTAAVTLLPLALFFVAARFRLPAYPALFLLAGAGAATLAQAKSVRRYAAFCFLYLMLNAPWPAAVAEDPAREALVRGEAALGADRPTEAQAAYRRVLKLDPEEGRAHLGLAVLADRAGDSQTALEHLELASRRRPGYWPVEEVWAGILNRQGRPAEAVLHLERAVADFPEHPELWERLGLTREVAEDLPGALAALEEAARLGMPSAEGWNSLGHLRRRANDRRGAEAAWTRALTLEPLAFKPRLNRGLLFAEDERFKLAVEDLERALQAARNPEEAARARRALDLVRRRLP